MPAVARRLARSALWGLCVFASWTAFRKSSGLFVWPAAGLLGITALGLVTSLLGWRGAARRGRRLFGAVALGVASVSVALALCEVVLWGFERAASTPLPDYPTSAPDTPAALPLPPALPAALREKIARMQAALVLPRAWEKLDLGRVPGRPEPYRWHGVVHVFDENRMRRVEPFPPRDPERARIMVVGDSLTFGEGVHSFWTYPAQLERALGRDYRVEVLNLGQQGIASEDVVEVVRRFLPELDPDLVVYGMCLNDFLPSLAAQPEHFVVPLPRKVKKILTRRTRLGRLVEQRYDLLLRRLGLRPDFYAELLAGFEDDDRSPRFGRDMEEMNRLVTGRGLPPVVALVLDQVPRLDGPGRRLALAAEGHMRDAGMQVVPSEPFYRENDGRNFRVSRWEGHPNEEAYALYAALLADALRGHAALAPYRRAERAGP